MQQEWRGRPWYGVFDSSAILLLEEPVVSRLSAVTDDPRYPGYKTPTSMINHFINVRVKDADSESLLCMESRVLNIVI
jgi:hypothetical protein